MGWFNYQDSDILLSDESLDAAHNFLLKITKEYQEAHGRNIKTEELEALLKISLGVATEDIFDDFETKNISDIKFKVGKKKKFQTFKVGDIFAAPLKTEGFVFGRILGITENQGFVIVEVFKHKANSKILPPKICENERLLPCFAESENKFKRWEWIIVRHSNSNLEDVKNLDFVIGAKGDHYLVSGDKVEMLLKGRPISDQDAEKYGDTSFLTVGARATIFEKALTNKK